MRTHKIVTADLCICLTDMLEIRQGLKFRVQLLFAVGKPALRGRFKIGDQTRCIWHSQLDCADKRRWSGGKQSQGHFDVT